MHDKHAFKALIRLSKNNNELIKLVNYLLENNIFVSRAIRKRFSNIREPEESPYIQKR